MHLSSWNARKSKNKHKEALPWNKNICVNIRSFTDHLRFTVLRFTLTPISKSTYTVLSTCCHLSSCKKKKKKLILKFDFLCVSAGEESRSLGGKNAFLMRVDHYKVRLPLCFTSDTLVTCFSPSVSLDTASPSWTSSLQNYELNKLLSFISYPVSDILL